MYHNFPTERVQMTNGPKPKYIQFATILNRVQQQIVTLEELGPDNYQSFCLKSDSFID